jgi:hypothetical protein
MEAISDNARQFIWKRDRATNLGDFFGSFSFKSQLDNVWSGAAPSVVAALEFLDEFSGSTHLQPRGSKQALLPAQRSVQVIHTLLSSKTIIEHSAPHLRLHGLCIARRSQING